MMGRISDDSPVGKALLGHAAGDAVTVEVQPGVHLKFKVLKVVTA